MLDRSSRRDCRNHFRAHGLTAMRSFFSVLCSAVLLATCLRAAEPVSDDPLDPFVGVPAPLAAALRGFGKDAPRWAYTQRFIQFDRKGRETDSWVARFDPSQHYDVQWTLMEKNGQPPTEAQQKKFRKERAKLERKGRVRLGEALEVKRAVLLPGRAGAEDELTYEVPLRPIEGSKFPPDKFQVFVRIDREKQALRAIDLKLRERVRVALVLNVKAADARIEFISVRPDAGPAIARITGGGTASVMLVPVGGRVEATRSDFLRVTPYDDRFVVKPGPLRTIDF
ncbi:MAG TPA: hypothetical protein VK477_03125 [Acidobacteriota bacterium]|nr:hypothetical protein [Acidobacteriota bacterium]